MEAGDDVDDAGASRGDASSKAERLWKSSSAVTTIASLPVWITLMTTRTDCLWSDYPVSCS